MAANPALYSANTWLAQTGTGLNRYYDSVSAKTLQLTSTPTTVTQTGTPFSATLMNHIETGVANASFEFYDKSSLGTFNRRKWANGEMEYWGTIECVNVYCSNAWGSMYESTSSYGNINWPTAFSGIPMCVTQVSYSDGDFVLLEPPTVNATKIGPFYLVRPTVSNSHSTIYVSVYARGLWK